MFETVKLTCQKDETLLPRVLRVLSKQGAHIKKLNLNAEAEVLTLEIKLEEEAGHTAAKLLEKQEAVLSVETIS